MQKLQQCCVLFDFFDSVTDLKSKEVKRATLNELVEYVSTSRGILVDSAYPDIINMVSTQPFFFVAHTLIKLPLQYVYNRNAHVGFF